jgi:hypothetical protein
MLNASEGYKYESLGSEVSLLDTQGPSPCTSNGLGSIVRVFFRTGQVQQNPIHPQVGRRTLPSPNRDLPHCLSIDAILWQCRSHRLGQPEYAARNHARDLARSQRGGEQPSNLTQPQPTEAFPGDPLQKSKCYNTQENRPEST